MITRAIHANQIPDPVALIRAIGALILIMAVVTTVGCERRSQKQNTVNAASPPAPPVTVAVAEQRAVPIQVMAIGTAQSYRTVLVRSQVSGQIERVLFQQGDFVRRGRVLFELDKKPFQAALDKALGDLAKDRATAANDKAQANRYEALLKAGVLAQETAEQQQAQAQAAAASVQSDEAAVEIARVNLSYTTIRAPIDGRAGEILVNVGNVVQANGQTPLTVINQISPIYVQFSVPEAQLSAIRNGGSEGLQVEAYPPNQSQISTGELTFINNTVDPNTGTIKLMATFPNRDQRLWPGEFLNVQLQLGVDRTVVVPADAVQSGQQGQYVYVVQQDGTAEMKPVQSPRTYRQLAVVEKGVSPGDTVIVNGQIRVIPGTKVKVTQSVPTIPNSEQVAQAPENQSEQAKAAQKSENGRGLTGAGGPQ